MTDEVYSQLMKELKEGKFVFTGELEPEKAGDVNEPIEMAKELVGMVVACNVTDNPQSFAYVSSLAASYQIQKKNGYGVHIPAQVRGQKSYGASI